jgi:hypothetical protein
MKFWLPERGNHDAAARVTVIAQQDVTEFMSKHVSEKDRRANVLEIAGSLYPDIGERYLRIPDDGDRHSELMPITITN